MSQSSGSFFWFFSSGFFFFLTYAEIKVFNLLKAFFLLGSAKENRSKRAAKKNHFFETCKPAIDVKLWVAKFDTALPTSFAQMVYPWVKFKDRIRWLVD